MTTIIVLSLLPQFPVVNAGLAPCKAMSSPMSKPQGAKTTSPVSKSFRKPLFIRMHFLVALPPQHLDRNDIAPHGVTPMRNFTVLCFL